MGNPIPVRLKKEPLLEAIWEIRCEVVKAPMADLLPGILFKTFAGKYSSVTKLPVGDLPAVVVEHDPNLRYAPKIRLESGNQAVQIGDRVVSLNCRRPYSGWAQFSRDIKELAEVVQETGLVERLERFSLKYIDLIESEKPMGLSLLNLELKLGGYHLATEPVQLRTEIRENSLTHIIQIISPAEVLLLGKGGRLEGVLVDIDSIRPMEQGESWDILFQALDAVHVSCKKMFFNMLKPETIESLEPEYEG
jgi:uncharacterized protein (TIGR04255 family)